MAFETSVSKEDGLRTDVRIKGITAALIGVGYAHVMSSHATIAKAFLFFSRKTYTIEQVAESSLHAIVILVGIGALLGALATRRKWLNIGQVVTSLSFGVFVAFVAIVDRSLPMPNSDGNPAIQFSKNMYFFVWFFGLWFLPAILSPSREGTSLGKIRPGFGLLIVAVSMSIAGLLAGLVLETLAECVFANCQQWSGGICCVNDVRKFWIAKPVAANAIFSAYVVVAFPSLWWREFWPPGLRTRIWNVCAFVLPFLYAGIYGPFLYSENQGASSVALFLAFGGLPIGVALTVVVAYNLSYQSSREGPIGWPVSNCFWVLLPLGFAITFAVSAFLGHNSVSLPSSGTDGIPGARIAAHGLNGLVLGLTLRIMPGALWLIRSWWEADRQG